MSSRYLALTCVERFLAVERYRQSHQSTPSSRPDRDHRPEGPGSRAKTAWPQASQASAKVR